MSQQKPKGKRTYAQSNLDNQIKKWDWRVFFNVLIKWPILEEVMFRGPVVLAGFLGAQVQGWIAAISLFWFVLHHRKNHQDLTEFMNAVPRYAILGGICTYVVWTQPWWNGVFAAIAIHFIWNVINLTVKIYHLQFKTTSK